ncbi:unnamed protein product, partial [Mesorhabditis belari]|uniref:Bromo domain-containing protein n=1 Tax=Mesorhabditis belari TaxID=2138241 RepID=A0AAF3F3T8_9BILA
MGDKTPLGRRSMVGAPPSIRPARTPKPTSALRQATLKKKGSKDVDEKQSEEYSEENSERETAESGHEEIDQEPKDKKRKKKLTEYTIKRKARDAAKAEAVNLRKKQIEEGVIDEEEPEPTPEPEPEEEEDSGAKPPKIRGYSPFQLLADHLLRKLMGKDPEEYFAFPVTPSMAPDYHEVITNPMDFSAMRQKIEDDKYEEIPQMRGDAELIVSNALAYNHPNTVYHLAATRLAHIVRFYFSDQHLRYLFHMMPRAREIPFEKIGLSPLAPLPKRFENKRREALHDPYGGKELLEKIPTAQSTRLTTRVPLLKNSHLAFIDNKDGATVLNILTAMGPSDKKEARLIDIVGPLEEGTPGMFTPIETRPNQTPITYLDYGPYSSFAPQFDSTWASMDKEESDLFLRTYGDRENVADALSLRSMVTNTNDHMLKVVDEFLDGLTDGEHSRTIRQLEKTNGKVVIKKEEPDLNTLLHEVETIGNLGLDTSVIGEIQARLKAEHELSIQQQLDRQGQALVDLTEMQRRRLSQQPPLTLTKVSGPSHVEIQLTNKVTTQLVNTIHSFAPPTELVSAPVLHNAMGIDDDDEIMSEFFQ